jgi:hypothetical protein
MGAFRVVMIAVRLLVLALIASVAAASPLLAQPMPSAATPTNGPLFNNVIDALASGSSERAAKLERVAAISDSRTVVVLKYVAVHDGLNPAAAAAVAGLGDLAKRQRPEAVVALGDLARGMRVRVARSALSELASLAPSESAWHQTLAVAKNHELPQSRRRFAIELLRRSFPKRAAATQLPRLSGPAVVPMLGGAFTGGYAFSVLGRFRSNGAEALGWLTGAFIGGGTGYIFGREMSLDRQSLYISSLFWGLVTGEMLSRTVIEAPARGNSGAVSGVFGVGLELAGFAAAVAFEDQLQLGASNTAFVNVSAAAGVAFGYGVSELAFHKLGTRGRNGAVLLSTVGWMATAATVAKKVELSGPDMSLQAFGALEGWWYGLWLGDVLHTSNGERESALDPEAWARDGVVGGMWLGAGLGYATATVISQHVELTHGDVGQMLVFGSYGKLLGVGASMFVTDNGGRQILASLGGGAVGIAVGALTTQSMKYNGGDVVLVPIATGWGFFHGAAVSSWLSDRKKISDERTAGVIVSSGALFGIASIAATQQLQLTRLESTMATTGAFWGAWLAGWGTSVASKDGSDALFAAAIGGDVGAAVTALMISPVFDVDPLILAGASFGGLSLAGVSSLLALMQTDDGDTITTVNLLGSTVGLIGGGLLARMWLARRAPERPKGTKAARFEPNLDGSTDLNWLRGFNVAPLLQDGAMTGATMQLSGAW